MAKLNKDKTADEHVRWIVRPHRKRPTKERMTKRDQLIRMLGAKNGAGVDAICRKLSWQPHTTRAAISGLRKSGFEVQSEKPNPSKPRRYCIVDQLMVEAADNAN
ncbi:hypothetical protein PEL8287_03441 [Roseovarius litorisediminis]|uniref:DUF3489 domain-containing protein n=1 Tax=Roseovarius litorisediminis TaxID=1312363 RepID=A0A1Y5TKZ6_9RHOB|nr:DUF3489 domain-containing protein [Roseovarius litorisediminis]SLN62799.1 hypothetical protein PEL8287_03441 [Roseovarius litorisediminis]